MRKLKCDGFGLNGNRCKGNATHRLVMQNAMLARIGQARAYLLCDEHAKHNECVLNYQLSKIED